MSDLDVSNLTLNEVNEQLEAISAVETAADEDVEAALTAYFDTYGAAPAGEEDATVIEARKNDLETRKAELTRPRKTVAKRETMGSGGGKRGRPAKKSSRSVSRSASASPVKSLQGDIISDDLKKYNINQQAFMVYVEPGQGYEEVVPEDERNSERKKAFIKTDLNVYYKVPFINPDTGKSMIKKVQDVNKKYILSLLGTLANLAEAFGKYGMKAGFTGGPSGYRVTYEDITYIKKLLEQRIKFSEYLIKAKSTRKPQEKPTIAEIVSQARNDAGAANKMAFGSANKRAVLTNEAKTWLKNEQFKAINVID